MSDAVILDSIVNNLRELREPCDAARARFWFGELSALLAPNIIDADTLVRAWRRVRADVQALRQSGKFAPAPLPETVVVAYWSCWEPPDLSGCGECSEGIVLRQDGAYEVASPCGCKAGDFRRMQRSRS